MNGGVNILPFCSDFLKPRVQRVRLKPYLFNLILRVNHLLQAVPQNSLQVNKQQGAFLRCLSLHLAVLSLTFNNSLQTVQELVRHLGEKSPLKSMSRPVLFRRPQVIDEAEEEEAVLEPHGCLSSWSHVGDVHDLSVSCDGRLLLEAYSEVLDIREVGSGKILKMIKESSEVKCCEFNADSSLMAYGCSDGTVVVLRAADYTPVFRNKVHAGFLTKCAFSPDSKILATSAGTNIKLLCCEDGTEIKTLCGHDSLVNHCCFSPDHAYLASCSNDNTIRLWNASEPFELVKTLSIHTSWVSSCCFFPSSAFLLSSSYDSTIKITNVKTGEVINTLTGPSSWVSACAVSSDGLLVCSCNRDGLLRMYQAESGQLVAELKAHDNEITACTFSFDSKFIFTSSEDETTKMWTVPDGFSNLRNFGLILPPEKEGMLQDNPGKLASLSQALQDLHHLIGISDIKRGVVTLISSILSNGSAALPLTLKHPTLIGGKGVGKDTVANCLCAALLSLDLFSEKMILSWELVFGQIETAEDRAALADSFVGRVIMCHVDDNFVSDASMLQFLVDLLCHPKIFAILTLNPDDFDHLVKERPELDALASPRFAFTDYSARDLAEICAKEVLASGLELQADREWLNSLFASMGEAMFPRFGDSVKDFVAKAKAHALLPKKRSIDLSPHSSFDQLTLSDVETKSSTMNVSSDELTSSDSPKAETRIIVSKNDLLATKETFIAEASSTRFMRRSSSSNFLLAPSFSRSSTLDQEGSPSVGSDSSSPAHSPTPSHRRNSDFSLDLRAPSPTPSFSRANSLSLRSAPSKPDIGAPVFSRSLSVNTPALPASLSSHKSPTPVRRTSLTARRPSVDKWDTSALDELLMNGESL